jgi:D-3-phosphoglycerate dehydrogenase
MMEDAGMEYDVRTGLKGEELRQALTEYDGAICRSGVKITAESLEGNTTLKAIARAGVGVDNIDLAAAKKHNIVVMNTPAGNTVSTAELTFALMLAVSRNIAAAHQSLVEGRWERKELGKTSYQLGGKTLGVVGTGRVGAKVIKFAQAFDMDVIAYDPTLSEKHAKEMGVKKVETVAEMLPVIDYLTVHTPLTNETRNLISDKEIDLMKKGAILVNCARGGIYDLDALQRGLESGKLGGVAMDVYPEEPCTDLPLFKMDHVVCTPHLGASAVEAQVNVALEAVEIMIEYLKTGVARNQCNK